MGIINNRINSFIYFFAVVLCLWGAGCQSKPLVIDTADIDRHRFEYQQLRSEYERLQQDYRELAESNQFYAEYYRRTTEAINAGLEELSNIGASSATEIQRLRELVGVLRDIIQTIIDSEPER